MSVNLFCGETVAHTGRDFEHRFGTKPYNGELGTYTYIYRECSPTLGRWLSEDPVLEQGGYNLYAYCGNEPVQNIDFIGMLNLFQGCCNGKKYNKLSKCCRDGITYGRWKKIDTEIKICRLPSESYSFIDHKWLETKNNSIDFVAGEGYWSIFGGKGQITLGTDYSNKPDKKCTIVKLNPCVYNIKKFEQNIEYLLYHYGNYETRYYNLLLYNCGDFVNELIFIAKVWSFFDE